MRPSRRSVTSVLLALMTLFGAIAFAYLADTSRQPPSGDANPPGNTVSWFTFPAPFGETYQRVTISTPPAGRRQEYSNSSPFSRNNVWLLVQAPGGFYELYRATNPGVTTYQLVRQLPGEISHSAEPRWSRDTRDPATADVFYYFFNSSERALKKYNAATNTTATVDDVSFDEYTKIGGAGESDVSSDGSQGDYMVVYGKKGTTNAPQWDVFVYGVGTGAQAKITATTHPIDRIHYTGNPAGNPPTQEIHYQPDKDMPFDNIAITHTRRVLINWLELVHRDYTRTWNSQTNTYNPPGEPTVEVVQPGRFALYEGNAFVRDVTNAGGHSDVGRSGDTAADEFLVWTNAGSANFPPGNPLPVHCIAKVPLDNPDGATCLLQLGYPHPTDHKGWQAEHISCPDTAGWCVVSLFTPGVERKIPTAEDPSPECPGDPATQFPCQPDPSLAHEWPAYTNEVVQLFFNQAGTDPKRRLFQHRSAGRQYESFPKAAVSPDGTFVAFSSNFGLPQAPSTLTPSEASQYRNYTDTYVAKVPASGPPPATPTPTPPGATPTPTPGSCGSWARTEQAGPSVTFTGNWYDNVNGVHSGGSVKGSTDTSDRATFSFSGTGVRLIAYKDEWAGKARIFVDGVDQGLYDTYSTPQSAQAQVFARTGLASGSHTIHVDVSGQRNAASGGNWVWVDAFEVQNCATATPTPTPTPPPPSWNRYEQTHASVTFTGNWYVNTNGVHSAGSVKGSTDTNDRATFTFTGIGIRLIAYKDEWAGKARIYVDGVDQGLFDTYSTPQSAQAQVFEKTGLAAGSHTIQVDVSGQRNAASGGNWIWVDAFDVLQ